MPVPTAIQTYYRAQDITSPTWDALENDARNGNIILPFAKKALDDEIAGVQESKNLWITYSTRQTVEFIVSCTGSYPVFIFTTLPLETLTDSYLRTRMESLAMALESAISNISSIKRVYSVFAPEPITNVFVEEWTRLTGIRHYGNDPYYAANISFCDKYTFVNRQITTHPSLMYDLRPAVEADIEGISALCLGFSKESFPFILDEHGAYEEAASLVHNKRVWVHTILKPGHSEPQIASIVAFTRNSDTVGCITKVYTNPVWRKHGCAERLTRRVCKHLLLTKKSVVLYVAHDNRAAAKVYHRVGFVGLGDDATPVRGVDRWLEIGFDRSQVNLGHW